MPVTEILNTCSRCKTKFGSKIIVHEIRGTNFWTPLYLVRIRVKSSTSKEF